LKNRSNEIRSNEIRIRRELPVFESGPTLTILGSGIQLVPNGHTLAGFCRWFGDNGYIPIKSTTQTQKIFLLMDFYFLQT
jgi:hypothetical protein